MPWWRKYWGGAAVSRANGMATSREIERLVLHVHDHLHLMWRLSFARIGERVRRGDHLEFAVPLQFAHQTIDQLRVDHWLVTLNVNDVRELLRLRRDFSDAVGSARMICRRHGDFGAPSECRLSDAEIICRDDQMIQSSSRAGSPPRRVAVTAFPRWDGAACLGNALKPNALE